MPVISIEFKEILIDHQVEPLAKALVTIIFEFYLKKSNTIFITLTQGGSRTLDGTSAAIISRICATIDEKLSLTLQITTHKKSCNTKFTNNIILIDSYESFR